MEQPHPATKGETVWKELVPVAIDVEKMEHLFETRAAEAKQKVCAFLGELYVWWVLCRCVVGIA